MKARSWECTWGETSSAGTGACTCDGVTETGEAALYIPEAVRLDVFMLKRTICIGIARNIVPFNINTSIKEQERRARQRLEYVMILTARSSNRILIIYCN